MDTSAETLAKTLPYWTSAPGDSLVSVRPNSAVMANICYKPRFMWAKTSVIPQVNSLRGEIYAAIMAVEETPYQGLEKVNLEGDAFIGY